MLDMAMLLAQVKVKLAPGAILPRRQTAGAVGYDLHAYCRNKAHGDVMWSISGESVKIPTGVYLELPHGLEAQIRPRSSLSVYGTHCALGTIDSDYRGELCAVLWCGEESSHIVRNGDRIAQLVISPVWLGELVHVGELSESPRGSGGFGSTGVR